MIITRREMEGRGGEGCGWKRLLDDDVVVLYISPDDKS